MIVANVCGFPCAGKSTAAAFMEKHGFLAIEASASMHQLYKDARSALPISRFAQTKLKEAPESVPRMIAASIPRDVERLVVSGFRSPHELQHMRGIYPNADFRVIFIEADVAIRFERCRLRARQDAASDISAFAAEDREQELMGVAEIRRGPAVKAVDNSGSTKDLETVIDSLVASWITLRGN